ncbi:MAG: DUF4410 domain-containing protein [Thermoanaerobaculia bacterium]
MRKPVRTIAYLAAVASVLLVPAAQAQNLDEGLLDPAWFGDARDWRQGGEFDYLWVNEGFSLDGKTVHVAAWEEPQFIGKPRDTKDRARAFELTGNMPQWLRGAFASGLSGRAEVSTEGGDVRLEGRFVDVNAGNNAAKWLVGFGAGSANATWDMRLVDAATGEVLAAIHHRSVSGTNMSDIDDKIIKWMDEVLVPGLQTGLASVYSGAKPAKK